MKIAEPARVRSIAAVGESDQTALIRCCELESIRTSIENLRTFPFVAQAVREREMMLLGVYFNLENGELLELSEQSGEFTPVVI
jgi:carbonic anhydrase